MVRRSGVAARGKSIVISFQYSGIQCRETIKLEPTKSNLKFAERKKAVIDLEIQHGTFKYREHFPDSRSRFADLFSTINRKVTIAKALDDYLAAKHRTLADSTYESYETAIRCHLKPSFGSKVITSLTTQDVRQWIGGLDVSNKRINNILIPLRGMMKDAYADGLIDRDPMDRITNLKVITREPSPFNAEEQTAIISASKINDIQFCFWTGLRIGELIALKWDDVDWSKGTVYIHRNNVRGRIKETKTEAGTRVVELLSPALAALKSQKLVTFLEGEEVFKNPNTKKAWNDDVTFRRAWAATIKRAGVRYREPKQMRHTYASMMLTAGENIAWVSRQIGHTSITTTLKKYARFIPQENMGAGSKAVEMFSEKTIASTQLQRKK